jgi:hypothetical protein
MLAAPFLQEYFLTQIYATELQGAVVELSFLVSTERPIGGEMALHGIALTQIIRATNAAINGVPILAQYQHPPIEIAYTKRSSNIPADDRIQPITERIYNSMDGAMPYEERMGEAEKKAQHILDIWHQAISCFFAPTLNEIYAQALPISTLPVYGAEPMNPDMNN